MLEIENVDIDKNDIMKHDNYFEITQFGINYKIIILGSEDVKNMFKCQAHVKLQNPSLSERSLTAYKFSNGEVLVIRDGENEYPLYPSEQVLIRQLNSHNPSEAKDILEGVNIYNEHFPAMAEELAVKFLRKMNISFDNKSAINVLKEVDDRINVNRNKTFFKENYISLIALVGSLINKEYGSSWIMIKSSKSDVWNPYIKYRENNIFFADYLLIDYDDKNEHNPVLLTYLSVTDIMRANT